MDKNIYISYRREEMESDETIDNLAKDALRDFPIFYDTDGSGLAGAKDWKLINKERLDAAPLVLIVFTERSLEILQQREPEDDEFRREITYAIEHGIAQLVCFKCAPPDKRALQKHGLEGLSARDIARINGTRADNEKSRVSDLRKKIARILTDMAFEGRVLSPTPDQTAGPGGTSALPVTPTTPKPRWEIETSGAIGLVGGPDGPTAVALAGEILSTHDHTGSRTSEVEVRGATSAALTSDGRIAVAAGGDLLWLAEIRRSRLRDPRSLPLEPEVAVVGAWSEGEVIVAAVRRGLRSHLLRIQPHVAREEHGVDAAWDSAVGIHGSGWLASGSDHVSGAGEMFDGLVPRVGQPIEHLDGTSGRREDAFRYVAVCRPVGPGTQVIVARGLRGRRMSTEHLSLAAPGRLMVMRGAPEGPAIGVATDRGVKMWRMDDLPLHDTGERQ